MQRHLNRRQIGPQIVLRPEEALLDTGGAVSAALAAGALEDEPFYVVNGDSFWLDGPSPTLQRLNNAFNSDVIDALLLVHRTFQVHGDVGRGDFSVDPWGSLRRRREREVAPFLYAGLQLVSPALFANSPGPTLQRQHALGSRH